MKNLSRKIITEFELRFSKTGKLQRGLAMLRNLKKQNPDNKTISEAIKAFQARIYKIGRSNSQYDKIFETYFPVQDGIFSIEGVKFDITPSLVRNILYEELVDLLCSDDFFQKSEKDQFFYQVMKTLQGEGPYQYGSAFLQQGDVVVDAGANIGMFSLFANRFYNCKCYAFEPVKSNIEILKKNIALNQMKINIDVVPYGLSDKACDLDIQIDRKHIGANSFVRKLTEWAEVEKIRCIALDQWAKENNIQKIDFIKADIEGAERYMLLGATEVLKTFAPKLSICTYHLPDDPQVLEEIIRKANPKYKIEHGRQKLYAWMP